MSLTMQRTRKRPVSRRANHSNVVTSVAFSPNGRYLASGSWDGTIKIWDVEDGKLELFRTIRGDWDEVEALAFSPDGSSIAGLGTGWDGEPFGAVTIWPLPAGPGRQLVRAHGKLDAIAYSPNGEILATASADGPTVVLWNVESGLAMDRLTGHPGPVWSVAFSPNGKLLAAASGEVPAIAGGRDERPIGEVRLWDVSKARPKARASLVGHEQGAVSVAFSPDGAILASGGFDRTVKLWNVASRREWATLEGHAGWVAALAFSPNGELLATGSHDQTIKLWDTETGQELTTAGGHRGNVYAVAFSPDGAWLASGSLDGTVRLWDVAELIEQREPMEQLETT